MKATTDTIFYLKKKKKKLTRVSSMLKGNKNQKLTEK